MTQRGDGCVVISIPVDPCNNNGQYPAGAEINLDFHGFYDCNGRQSDFDLFGVRVLPNPFGIFCQNVMTSLANQLQTLLGAEFVVTTDPATCEIIVCPAPGCTFNLGWGTLRVTC